MSAVVGVAWYSRAAWTRLRALVPDADRLEETYEDWVGVFERGVADLRAAGLAPARVAVDVDAFMAWCAGHALRPDSGARARFAADELRRRHAPPPRAGGV